jgi:hypothetical protein
MPTHHGQGNNAIESCMGADQELSAEGCKLHRQCNIVGLQSKVCLSQRLSHYSGIH